MSEKLLFLNVNNDSTVNNRNDKAFFYFILTNFASVAIEISTGCYIALRKYRACLTCVRLIKEGNKGGERALNKSSK